jgi:arylsulfatase A-like enzyme
MYQPTRWLYLIPIALILAAVLLQLNATREPRPMGSPAGIRNLRERDDLNVLFVVIDTLRAHRLGAYGYARPTSPTLDALARTGVRFSRHLSQSSWTKTSMASLWTGVYPMRTGILRYDHALPDEAQMPAEILRDAAYRTAGIWRNGWVASNFGFSQGFGLYHKPDPGRVQTAHRRDNPASRIMGSDLDISQSATEFLRVYGHERWFLYLHYMDVHQYLSDETSALFGTSYSDIYDNSIHWVDRQIQVLLDILDERDLRERTLIVVVSDHGEAFGEHGKEGHAKDLYGEVTETPFILSLPFRLEPGVVVDAPSENVDVWPTLLDLLGLPALPESDGRSLLPAMSGAPTADPPEMHASIGHLDRAWGRVGVPSLPVVSLTRAPYRFIHHAAGQAKDELYDLENDPRERDDLGDLQPETAERMRAQVTQYLEQRTPPWGIGPHSVEIDDMMLGQLRAIGYAIE